MERWDRIFSGYGSLTDDVRYGSFSASSSTVKVLFVTFDTECQVPYSSRQAEH